MVEINTIDLDKINCKKYKALDEDGNLIKALEKNENGEWIDTTLTEQLKIEIEREQKELQKLQKEN